MSSAMQIVAVERVLVAVANLDEARSNWSRAGFAIASGSFSDGGLEFARMATGAVEIDLVGLLPGERTSALAEPVAARIENGGGIIGWIWGLGEPASESAQRVTIVPGSRESGEIADLVPSALPGVFTAALEIDGDLEARRARLATKCGSNPNTVDYLEHIVVMTPDLEHAISQSAAIGVPCKRIRELGNGTRQAFFKLEQTVLEVVGPSRGEPGCWGLALMCSDIHTAVAHARNSGLQATEPKAAIQGGLIARIIEPLDGVAIAFMQSGPRRDT
ncbi:MAG TPA: hypothetical protein VMA09_10110 [Candidatus Binataceae bacterium]|nr:hypothetical protein [Candidatus Binataceae bacterium]